jgi:hypothetical protein
LWVRTLVRSNASATICASSAKTAEGYEPRHCRKCAANL